MDLRRLVRRIADALGPDATPERVERVALALLAPADDAPPAPAPGGRAVVVATGPADAPGADGLLPALAAAAAEAGARVGDVTRRIEGGRVALRMDLDAGPAALADLRARLEAAGRAGGAAVVVQPADLHAALHAG